MIRHPGPSRLLVLLDDLGPRASLSGRNRASKRDSEICWPLIGKYRPRVPPSECVPTSPEGCRRRLPRSARARARSAAGISTQSGAIRSQPRHLNGRAGLPVTKSALSRVFGAKNVHLSTKHPGYSQAKSLKFHGLSWSDPRFPRLSQLNDLACPTQDTAPPADNTLGIAPAGHPPTGTRGFRCGRLRVWPRRPDRQDQATPRHRGETS